jgi:PAS domain S-box-containing protein
MWKTVFENSPFSFGLWDKELNYVRVNKAFADLDGVAVENHSGKSVLEILPDIGAEISSLLKKVMQTGEPLIGHEISFQPQNDPGSLRTWSMSYYPYIVDDVTEGVWASCEDLTTRKRIEAERNRIEAEALYGEAKYRSLVKAIATIVWNSDAAGKIIGDAPIWREITGQTIDEVRNQGWRKIIHPDDLEKTSLLWDQSLREEKSFETEYRLKVKNGEYRHFAVRGVPVSNNDGKVHEWIGVLIDIEDQKRAEVQLRQSAAEREEILNREQQARQEAEQANRLKDEFLATLSHELRTPLTATVGWVKMLRAGQLEPKDAAYALETIERNTQVQKQLIEDLLDVSRIITGKLRLDVRPVNLEKIVRTAIESILLSAQIKEIEIIDKIEPNTETVYADPHRLQQVLWNLLSNAMKFTPKGGQISVSLRKLDNQLEVSLKDTGIGIKPELLARIFDRFRQADSTTTRKHGGLGLGLAIVQHLIEAHGGTVEAFSDGEGAGSTFSFRLPVISQSAMPEIPRNQTGELPNPQLLKALRLDKLQLLVVDDDQDNLDLLKLLLSRYGAKVVTANSVAEAMSQLLHYHPNIIVSDIGMPIEDGYQFIRKIRALPQDKGGKIPAIALTAFAKTEDREKALSLGFQKHITKPVDPLDLVKAIAELAN